MGSKFILKASVKKYSPYLLLIALLLFVVSLSLPKLAVTRDDAVRARMEHNLNMEVDKDISKSTNYKLNATEFEIKKYEIKYSTNETAKLQQEIETLRSKDYLFFDKYDKSKSRSFYIIKVDKDHADEILNFFKSLKPKDIHLYVENIKKSIESSIDKEKLLKDKLTKLEKILSDANKQYSALSILAKKQNNIDSLTKLIDLKVNTLDRLTKEKSTILTQINTISKSK